MILSNHIIPTSSITSTYVLCRQKRGFDIFAGLVLLVVCLPLLTSISILIFVTIGHPIFYIQSRVGLHKRSFKLIKFRTMRRSAEKEQKHFCHLNEADGPTFKIRNDPRFVGIGKFLSNTGLDELPQLFNVIKGEMSLVGPRPLPIEEARKLNSVYGFRFEVTPGMTSLWQLNGSHKLSFHQWMEFDRYYIDNANIKLDFEILWQTMVCMLCWLKNKL